MRIRFACPYCEQTSQATLTDDAEQLRCSHCDVQWSMPAGSVSENQIRRCVVCPSEELFLRKDFPQRLGLTIVVTGFAVSCVTWYYHMVMLTFVVLFASAFVDVILYALVENMLTCYRCHAEYREVEESEHSAFDLEVHERYRQQEARLKDQQDEPKSRDDRGGPAGLARW